MSQSIIHLMTGGSSTGQLPSRAHRGFDGWGWRSERPKSRHLCHVCRGWRVQTIVRGEGGIELDLNGFNLNSPLLTIFLKQIWIDIDPQTGFMWYRDPAVDGLNKRAGQTVAQEILGAIHF